MIHHHSHRCPLDRHDGCGNFTCDGCGRGGSSSRYRCHNCDFDLHLSCAKYSFPCHGHELTYEPFVQPGVQVSCDACNTRVCGTHYSCRGCDFQVHPACVQRRTTQPSTPPAPQPCPCHTVYCPCCYWCNQQRRC